MATACRMDHSRPFRRLRDGADGSYTLRTGTGVVPAASIEDTAGVEVVSLRKTAAGRMLDFRFRVIDPEKAAPLLSRGTPAYISDTATGAIMPVPITKIGSMRQTTRQPEEGRVYFMFFQDAGQQVKSGDKVTVVIGEHRFENLTVQ